MGGALKLVLVYNYMRMGSHVKVLPFGLGGKLRLVFMNLAIFLGLLSPVPKDFHWVWSICGGVSGSLDF